MPANWTGYGNAIRNAPHTPGPSLPGGMSSVTPSARAPMKSDQTAAQRSFNLIPNQPTPTEIARTIEHVTGKPAERAEVQQLMEDTQATYGDFAPGGQVAQSGPGQATVR